MDRETAFRLHEAMLLTRLTEERLVKLFRQGHTMGSVYRSLGQEATSCATAFALGEEDLIAPMIRNLGSMFVRGATPLEIFLQYLGRATGPTGGREHNNHFGSVARGILAPTSMLGALIPVMAGVALSFRLWGDPELVVFPGGVGKPREAPVAIRAGGPDRLTITVPARRTPADSATVAAASNARVLGSTTTP